MVPSGHRLEQCWTWAPGRGWRDREEGAFDGPALRSWPCTRNGDGETCRRGVVARGLGRCSRWQMDTCRPPPHPGPVRRQQEWQSNDDDRLVGCTEKRR